MGRAAFLLIVVGLLAGCQTKPIESMSYTELNALAGQVKDRCIAQGVRPGTKNFEVCFRQEAMRESYTRQANREMVRRVGRGLAAAGAASTPTHTTCTRAWNTVNCTTF